MAWEFAKDRKKRFALVWGCLAFAVVGFACAIHWGLDGLVLPVSLAATLSLLLCFPVYTCSRCGFGNLLSGRSIPDCPKCKEPYTMSAGTVFDLFQGRKRLLLEIPLVVILLFISSIRITCLAILVIHILFAIFMPIQKRNRWMNFTAVAILVFMLLPMDVEVAGFHGPHYGVHGKGLRFVRLVKGMPKIRRCLERYGEFISGGCVVFGNEPRWLLVWDAANGKGLDYFDRVRKGPIEKSKPDDEKKS